MLNESTSYLWDIVSGGFKEEDRLTNIFCSSFDESDNFKKLFFDFIGHHRGLSFRAVARRSDEDSRLIPDVRIKDRNERHLKILIENKIERPLTYEQLNKYYKGISDAKHLDRRCRIALVKDYFEKPHDKWEVKHWSEFSHRIKRSKIYKTLFTTRLVKNIL